MIKKMIWTVLTVLFLVQCSSEEATAPPKEKSYTITLKDYFTGDILSTSGTLELQNGAVLTLNVIDEESDYSSLDLLEVKNKSNEKIEVLRFEDRLVFKTESYTNESSTLDLYYSGKKLKTISILIRVLYKIKKDGVDLKGDQKLAFNNSYTPENLEIYRLDGKSLEGFKPFKSSIVFKNNEYNTNDNYEVFPGDNFKLIFKPFSDGITNRKLSLYYSSYEETQNRDVFVKDFDIEVNYKESENCKIYSKVQKIKYPWDTEETFDYRYEYEKVGDKFVSVKPNCGGCNKNMIFYDSEGRLVEIQEEVKYEYEDDLLKKSIVFNNNSSEPMLNIIHNYNSNKDKVNRITYLSDGITMRDSIVYKDFVNHKPLKIFSYDKDHNLIRYAENEYDVNGNIIAIKGSNEGDVNLFNYSVTYEYSNSHSYTVHPFGNGNDEALYDASFFIEKPVRTKVEIFDIKMNRIDFEENVTDITKDVNITTIRSEYKGYSSSGFYTRIVEYSSSECE